MRIAFIVAALLAFLGTSPAQAQNTQCRTAPVGTSTANCASEAFVTDSLGWHEVVAFAQLPTCNSAAKGSSVFITNSNTGTFNASITGTGSNTGLAVCDGTNWKFH